MLISNIPNLSSMSMVRAKVDLYDGPTLVKTCTCGDVLSDFVVTREGDNSKFFGFGVCHKLDINFIDIYRELAVTKGNTAEIGLGDGGDLWDAPYPTFYITEIKRNEKTNTITGTAYDKLYWANEYLFKDLGLEAPYTLRQVAQAVATKLGVSLQINSSLSTAFALSYEKGANLEGTETLRAVLNWIAEATQTIYYLNSTNTLVFKRLDKNGEAVEHITKDDYYELNTKTPRTLQAIYHVTELGDNLEDSLAEDGAIQYIRNNPFIELRTDIPTILENALAAVGGLTITQFECDWVGNYLLEIGDKLALTTENDEEVYSYLLSDTVTYGGTLDEVSEWEYADDQAGTFANPTNIGERLNQTFAKVDKLEKEITLYVGEVVEDVVQEVVPEKVEELTGGLVSDMKGLKASQTTLETNMSQLQLTTDSITQKVEETEQTVTQLSGTVSTSKQEAIDAAKGYTDSQVEAVVTQLNTKVAEINVTTDEIDQRVTQTEEKTVSVESDIAANNAAIQVNSSSIGELQIKSNNISASVQAIQETTTTNINTMHEEISELTNKVDAQITTEDVTIKISEALSNGIDKVTTSTGYTFDDEGLHISKSNAEMTSILNEDGLEVSRYSTPVLTAKSEGVNALNIKVRQFLNVGGSRFEKYKSNRTGCFWIGD